MVTNKKTCEVATHFNRTPHTLSDFSFQCIGQVQASSDSDRMDKLLITKEAYWSAQLFSLAPFGLNKRQEFHSKTELRTTSLFFCQRGNLAIKRSLGFGRSKALISNSVSFAGVRCSQGP